MLHTPSEANSISFMKIALRHLDSFDNSWMQDLFVSAIATQSLSDCLKDKAMDHESI